MAVTIKDVAREAGVSVATVSRAMNGHGSVAPAVRERVLAVARALDYAPHPAARALGGRRTHTIGVVLPDLHGEFFSELIRGMGQVARAHRLHLLVSSDHGDAEGQGAALQAMRGRVDGVLVMASTDASARELPAQLPRALPAVLLNTPGPPGLPVIGVDNRAGARAMTRHLVESGRRRIAFIAGPRDNPEARERLRGHCEALEVLLPGTPPRIVPGGFDEASGRQAAQRLLDSGDLPDAIFAGNDVMAIACLHALAGRGVDVPGDVAVAGFDDIPLARHVHPALTTVKVDIAGLGARAMETLIGPADGEGAAAARPIVPELVIRGSSRRD